jgi:chromosome segregation ATPase
MEDFFKQIGLPLEDMITAWGKKGIEEWAIREAAEEWYDCKSGGEIYDPIQVSWEILSRAENKRPISQTENITQSDPNIRTEINRLRGVIANLREAISDLLTDKEQMWAKVEALQAQSKRAELEIKELRKDNLVFSGEIESVDMRLHKKFKDVNDEIEAIRLAAELDKLENDSTDLKEEVKTKRRWWKVKGA